jgi:hypothetical protein
MAKWHRFAGTKVIRDWAASPCQPRPHETTARYGRNDMALSEDQDEPPANAADDDTGNSAAIVSPVTPPSPAGRAGGQAANTAGASPAGGSPAGGSRIGGSRIGGSRSRSGRGAGLGAGRRGLAVRNADALIFAADMYAVQLDQLAALTGGERPARAAAARWRELGYAETAVLSPGPAWVWVTRTGLAACGLTYQPARPGLSRLAHIRAVTAARVALEATSGYRVASAFWRCERRIRSRHGVGVRQHLPDAEVHWPDGSPVAWAGECWAVEAELTPKTVARTVAIMREILARTGDYGCPAAEASVPGRPPRHARALYLCSPAALSTVLRARDALGPLAARIEVRDLPPAALLP